MYADNRLWRSGERSIFSSKHHLIGKPDYLVRSGDGTLPVEVKSSQAPGSGPHDSHVLQLAAYCLLVEENSGLRPSHGLIKYNDDLYEVDYTPCLERELLELMNTMRDDAISVEVDRSHQEAARCLKCGLRQETYYLEKMLIPFQRFRKILVDL